MFLRGKRGYKKQRTDRTRQDKIEVCQNSGVSEPCRKSGSKAMQKRLIARFAWVGLGAVLLAGALAGIMVFLHAKASAAEGTRPAVAEIPVTVARAVQRDVPVYLVGIGNVQALNTVLVRARVDGYLQEIHFTEGQMVRKGDLLAVIDPRPYQAALDQAKAQKAKDEAALVAARLDLIRYRNLAKDQFAPQQQVDDQQALVNQTLAAIKADEAAIETAALNLYYTRLTSPIDGRVGLRMVDIGNLIHATDTNGIVSITQIHPITAVFTLPESDLPAVMQAMAKGPVEVLAYLSDHRTRLAEGTLLTPHNTIDTGSATIELKAIFENKDDKLWPGQFIDARVKVRTIPNAVTVPDAAVQRGMNGLFVFVVNQNHTVTMQPVKEELEQDGIAVITSGLSAGTLVVTNGQSRLQNGSHVAVREAAASDALQAQGG